VGLILLGLGALGLLVGGGYWVATSVPKLFKRGIAESEWKPFAPPDGHFTVLMPGTPELDEQSVAAGYHQYILKRKSEVVGFVVAYADITLEAAEDPAFLSQAAKENLDAMFAQLKAEKINRRNSNHKERNVLVSGYPGREYLIDAGKKGTIIERLCVVKTPSLCRLYVLRAGGGERVKDVGGDAAKFSDSFKITLGAPR
jgi:hypothetical protein